MIIVLGTLENLFSTSTRKRIMVTIVRNLCVRGFFTVQPEFEIYLLVERNAWRLMRSSCINPLKTTKPRLCQPGPPTSNSWRNMSQKGSGRDFLNSWKTVKQSISFSFTIFEIQCNEEFVSLHAWVGVMTLRIRSWHTFISLSPLYWT